jgi:hypothetical protein
MAMFGPAAQAAFQERQNYMAVGDQPGANPFQRMMNRAAQRLAMPTMAMLRQLGGAMNQRGQFGGAQTMGGNWNSSSPTTVMSPGQTQVIRPSQQQQQRAQAPQAGASSSLITSTPSPAEVALATTSLLGG